MHVLGIGLVWRRRAEEQEVNFWLMCCAEQDVPCVFAQKQIESWRTGRERSRASAAGWTRAIVLVWKHVPTSKTHFSVKEKKTLCCISSFPSSHCSLGINISIIKMVNFTRWTMNQMWGYKHFYILFILEILLFNVAFLFELSNCSESVVQSDISSDLIKLENSSDNWLI